MPDTPPDVVFGTILQPLDLQAVNAKGENGAGDDGPRYAVPEWIPMVPNGPVVQGRDRRAFQMDDPQACIDATSFPIALDWDHGSVSAMWRDGDRPGKAAARITEMEKRDDGVWGRCEWTADGYKSVERGEYLYISPVFILRWSDDDDLPEVKSFTSAALTNNPNLTMPSLNRQETPMPGAKPKDNTPGLAGATEPGAGADTNAAAQAAQAGEAPAAPAAPVDMVPRAQYDAVVQQMNSMQETLNELNERDRQREKAAHDAAVNAAIDKAVTDRKITPTPDVRAFWTKHCEAEGGLQSFQAYVDTLPQLLPDSGLDNAAPPVDTTPPPGASPNSDGSRPTELSAAQKKVAVAMNVSEEEMLKTIQERHDRQVEEYGHALV